MSAHTYRILDANLNRAREAFRTIEDYARLALENQALSDALKALRHELVVATKSLDDEAIIWRDVASDAGARIDRPRPETETMRADLGDIITAAGKRLGESLRVIEESCKVLDRPAAARVEHVRHRFYDLERAIALTLRPAARMSSVRLYVLITEAICRRPWLETAAAALAGGANCLQLREKELGSGELLNRARQLVDLCHLQGATCIINDRPDIALLSKADGVHVGQRDMPALEARKLMGGSKIVGVSTHNIDQARQARLDGADYIGVGPIYQSGTKPRGWTKLPGLAYAQQVTTELPGLPTVAIAGITAENIADVAATGVSAFAVTAAVVGADDVQRAARELKTSFIAARTSGNQNPV